MEDQSRQCPTDPSIEENYKSALESIISLIENYEIMLIHFSRKQYASSFEEYLEKGKEVLMPAEAYATVSINNLETASKELATRLVEGIEAQIEKMKFGPLTSTKGKVIDQFRFFLAVYTVPMILKLDFSLSEPLSNEIIRVWKQHYPKFEFMKGNYDRLQEGFEKKGWCYITTAVCESMEKPDDCYELTAFRGFRDTYMQSSQERIHMVEEYYHTAPVIVASIDLRPDSREKYEEIWNSYLQPCLKNLEGEHFDDCERRYIQMVRDLKELYYIF